MRRITALLLAGLAALTLTGCRRGPGLLPYAREIEDMELMQTLGVDRAGEGQVEVTASSGSGDPAEGAATVVSGQAGTISAAVLGMQGEGSSYLYFGHVGPLLLGEGLARQGVEPALDYILRDVETRLDTALYLVRGGTAGKAITAAGEDGSAADRLEALAEDAGLLAGSMPRTVKDALSDLYAQGATFLPAVKADEALTAAGYGILKGDRLAGWAEGDAALGVNLVLGQVDADVVELPLDGGGVAALRVVGARTSVRPVMDGGALTGLSLTCTLDANMAEGNLDLRTEEVHASLETALAQVEEARIRSALELAQELDADYLGLLRRAALARPWHKEALEGASLGALELELHVTAKLQRSYDAAR